MGKRESNLADQIRDAIRASGMMQREIAEQIGVTKGMLSRFLAGQRWIGEKAFNDLAKLLGLTITTRKKGQ